MLALFSKNKMELNAKNIFAYVRRIPIEYSEICL